jgi:pimeloyl-ACP methyl ester carboxylesterase
MTTKTLSAPPTVIALHSSAASGRQWRALAAGLDGTHRVVAPDLHGHGEGPMAPRDPASIVEADTDYVVRQAMANPDGVHLVGHSYGGAIALRVARRCGAQVRSLTLVEPVAFRVLFDRYGERRPAAEIVDLARAITMFVRGGRSGLAAQRFVGYWGGESAWARLGPDARATVAARMGAVAAHFDALAADDLTLDACRAIAAPTLMLAGSRTRTPALRIAELVASALPDVRDERLGGGNHVEALESPGRIVARVAAFLATVDARDAARIKEAA